MTPGRTRRLVLVNNFAYFPRRATIGLLARLGPYLPARPSHPATRPVRDSPLLECREGRGRSCSASWA